MSHAVNQGGSTTSTISLLTQKRIWVESPLIHDELHIYWRERPFDTNRYPIGFNVYRGLAPNMTISSPQSVKLTASPVVVPYYRDQTVETHTGQQWYYLVTEVFTDGSEVALDSPATLGTAIGGVDRNYLSPVRIFREYRRRKYILLNEDAEQVDFLIRRRAGTRCDCFSGEYEQSGNAACSTCYGTGWTRGYELLRSVQCRIHTISEALRLQPQGLIFNSGPRAWLVDFPLLRNGDVLVRRNTERYEVDKIDPAIHQGVLTHQDFQLIVLPNTHPVYSYVIPDSDVA